MRVDTPTHESPPAGEIGDLPPVGKPMPPPTLMSIAQCGQLHNAAEAYIRALEKEGRVIGGANTSHLNSAPWAILAAHRPAGPMAGATTAPRRYDAVAATATGLHAMANTRETAGGLTRPGRAGVDVAGPDGDGRRSGRTFYSDVEFRHQEGRTPQGEHTHGGV